jgi:hypothetical protein
MEPLTRKDAQTVFEFFHPPHGDCGMRIAEWKK